MEKMEVEVKKILSESILRLNGVELRARKIGDFQVAEQLNKNKIKLRAILKS